MTSTNDLSHCDIAFFDECTFELIVHIVDFSLGQHSIHTSIDDTEIRSN